MYLIHLDYGYHPANGWPYRYIGRHLLVTTIDLNANNGSGKTISKNVSLLDGVLMTAAAVRHANGRDWWIMCSDADENRHYRLLLTPDGFKGPFTQEIGTKPSPIGLNNSGFGNSFSSKGNYYVDGNSYLGFSIFRFNRCTGLLSDERRVEWPEPLTPPNDNQQHEPGGGYMFSSDEKLLYVTASFDLAKHPALPVGSKPYLFQFDLSASDLFASIDTINPIDSLKFFPYAYTDEVMYGAEMGPDGRIYIMHNGEAYCTVQYPNVRGKGCGFRYNEPNFNNIIGQAIPVLPNYRLGPIDGSACDTLGLNNIPVANFRTDDTLGLLARFFYDLSFKEPTNWFWNFGDGTTSQDTSLLHEFAEPGKYQVCLTVSNSNGSDTYCREVFIGISAQKEPSPANLDLRVFPNPAQESVTIVILGASPASGTLTVSDLHGRLVLQQPFRAVNSQLLDLRGWQPGVYFLSLETTDGNRQVRRLFVGP
ncbi:MAG: T9SS type A sorting domain-containing protein [Lewinellaceae bacterium]|nr:T9SS type A sorting domain-containing protein [Lewinellaceae bacterium]